MTVSRAPDRAGTAAGVPYIAFAPGEPRQDSPLVYVLHLMDPPRSERAMAAALPLKGLNAWTVYAGLPMSGERAPAGGWEEIQRLANEDGLMLLLAPVIEQASAELPAAVAALREEFEVLDGPLALVGGSAGGAAVLNALATGSIDAKAAALVNPATRAGGVVDSIEQLSGFTYGWTDVSRAKADQLDFTRRAADFVRNEVPLRIIVGEDDALKELPIASKALIGTLAGAYEDAGRASFITIPGLGHGLTDEPGIEPAPQNEHAKQVDAAIVEWLKRWLPA